MPNLRELTKSLNAEEPPATIWQPTYDSDPSLFKRLCNLRGQLPDGADVRDYAEILLYEERVQADLFKYLLPICLQAWSEYLLNHKPNFASFSEYFLPALLRNDQLATILSAEEQSAVETFFRETILLRIDQERSTKVERPTFTYDWFDAFNQYAVAFATLSSLWHEWWQIDTTGRAICSLQYIACLAYEADKNPIFPAWTPDHGGGPPLLSETGTHLRHRGWRCENIEFLKNTLSHLYLVDALKSARIRLANDADGLALAERMLSDIPQQAWLIDLRLEELPVLLSSPELSEWPAEGS